MDKATILEKLHQWNPWWSGRSFALPSFCRDPFDAVKDSLQKGKIQVLAGPRQTGKTTLLRQLIQYLHRKGVNRTMTLYLPLDDFFIKKPHQEELSLRDLLQVFSEEVAKSPLDTGDKYIFLDEVHVHSSWSQEVKLLHDQALPIHIVVSGSAAANILSAAARDLAGRSMEYIVLPLTFAEGLRSKLSQSDQELIEAQGKSIGEAFLLSFEDKGRLLRNVVRKASIETAGAASILRAELAHYLRRGGFPEPVLKNLSEEESDHHLHTILDQMILRDFVDFFHIRDTRSFERLIHILAQNTGRILTEGKLSSDLGIAINTLRNHLGFLEKVYVVFAAHAMTASKLIQSRIPEKYFFLDPGLRNSLVGYRLEDRGQLLESAVYVHLWNFFKKHRPSVEIEYWRKKDREVDMVLKQGKAAIGIEVHTKDPDTEHLQKFMAEEKITLGLLISEGVEEKIQEEVVYLPPHLLLLIT